MTEYDPYEDDDLPWPFTEQDIHNAMLARSKPKLIPKAEMEALIAENAPLPKRWQHIIDSDPIANAMANNPGLTRDEAEKIAEAFGFI